MTAPARPVGPRPEVVTTAAMRLVDVPGAPGPIALITVDNGKDHTRPTSLGPIGLANLDGALDQAFAAAPVAIAITGKPYIFLAGADLSQIASIPDLQTGREIAALGQRTFGRLRESAIPTFAFVNGIALGGGVELALACHYRTVAANAAAMALPEVFLGILPGWGGTQLLPRLIGPENAVTVIIENPLNTNRMLRPKDALRLGVVDTVVDAADFLEQSLEWAVQVVRGSITVPRTDFHDEKYATEWDSALARGRILADMKTHGAAPAAYRALQSIEFGRTAALSEGLAAEAAGLGELIMSPEFRAGLYSFDLVQKRCLHSIAAFS